MAYLKIKSFDKFRDTFSDLNETMFIEKEDRIEFYSTIKGNPAVYQFDLLKSEIKTDKETFIRFLRETALELVDAR